MGNLVFFPEIRRKLEPVVKKVVKINGSTVRYNKDYTLMEVCDAVGIRIPLFCYTEQALIWSFLPKTPLFKKVREGVLEFLLLNPPTCDPDGECDLQEQSRTFGGDSCRDQLFTKRPVQDKSLHFFIKTLIPRVLNCEMEYAMIPLKPG
jgi:NADH-quinone oxidoreductase subunit G